MQKKPEKNSASTLTEKLAESMVQLARNDREKNLINL
jgi:hypothetical protein